MKYSFAKKLRVALLGYGKVADLHAQALVGTKDADLATVCGRNRARRDAFAAKWGISSRETVEEAVLKDKIDAVIVSVPHPQHKASALEALEAGCHVLVEKPMALNTPECDAMIAGARKAGKVLSVMSQRRFFPACARMKEAILAGKIGKPSIAQLTILGWRDEAYYASDSWRGKWSSEGGGILINQAPHQIDLMLWFMGPFAELRGFWGNVNHPYIEVEDTAVAAVKFANGGFGSVLASNSQKPGIYAKVHIHGEAAASVGVQTDGGAMFIAGMSSIAEPPLNDLWTIAGEEKLLDRFRAEDEAFFKTIDPTIHFFTLQFNDFFGAIIEGRAPLVSAEDGRETVRFIETLYGGAINHDHSN
ncbi:MAG: Gfo/Idh/MocA family oxidoreductase [Spirochaetaceae bacterium]|jgi:predicted dehydrogenase|nr:Gfo/Idh/MocA family oxidoreductase [Spirochaetaceae bacterium]